MDNEDLLKTKWPLYKASNETHVSNGNVRHIIYKRFTQSHVCYGFTQHYYSRCHVTCVGARLGIGQARARLLRALCWSAVCCMCRFNTLSAGDCRALLAHWRTQFRGRDSGSSSIEQTETSLDLNVSPNYLWWKHSRSESISNLIT